MVAVLSVAPPHHNSISSIIPPLITVGVVANTWPLKLLYELCEGGDLHKQLLSDQASTWQWANKYAVNMGWLGMH